MPRRAAGSAWYAHVLDRSRLVDRLNCPIVGSSPPLNTRDMSRIESARDSWTDRSGDVDEVQAVAVFRSVLKYVDVEDQVAPAFFFGPEVDQAAPVIAEP